MIVVTGSCGGRMNTAIGKFARRACRHRREDDLQIILAIFVACYLLFAR